MLSNNDRRRVDEATKYFVINRDLFESFAKSLMIDFQSDSELKKFIHFIKYRIKDEDNLRVKLEKKIRENPDEQNLASKVTDFAGLRIIYLHMDQFSSIHTCVSKILEHNECELLGSPKAYCWDSEYENLFRQADVETELKESMYTTVHYDIVANKQKPTRSAFGRPPPTMKRISPLPLRSLSAEEQPNPMSAVRPSAAGFKAGA